MIELKDLLTKYNNFLFSEDEKKETIKKIIFETTRLHIATSDIELKGDNVFLHTKPVYKSEIFLKREQIDLLLEQTLGNKKPTRLN